VYACTCACAWGCVRGAFVREVSILTCSLPQASGLNFTGKCNRYPNTVKAHALMHYVGEHRPAVQHELAGLLFKM